MTLSKCLNGLNACLAGWLKAVPRRRKIRQPANAVLEALEQRQLLVADPTGLWDLTTDAHTGDGTAVISMAGNNLHFAGSFPDFQFTFEIDASPVGSDGNHFKGKDKLILFGGNSRAKIKFELDFTSENAFIGTSKTKFKGSARITQTINGARAVG